MILAALLAATVAAGPCDRHDAASSVAACTAAIKATQDQLSLLRLRLKNGIDIHTYDTARAKLAQQLDDQTATLDDIKAHPQEFPGPK